MYQTKLFRIQFIVIFIFLVVNCNAQSKFSADEVKEDFKYLYETLEAASYDLFYYTERAVFEKEFERINNSITDSLTLLEIKRVFQTFVALANFQHCSIEFPYSEYRYFYKNGGRFFPFEIAFIDNKPTVAIDYTENININVGDELISIGGVPFQNILEEIFTYMSGENDYARRGIMEIGDFMDSYWYALGDFSDTTIQVKKHTSGEIININDVKGVLLKEYSDYNKNHPELPSVLNSNREFRYIEEVAYFHPGPFYNIASETGNLTQEALKSDDFKAFVDSVFTDISQRNTRELIIDIRGNAGGNDSFSSYMMAYFAKRPYRIASKFSMKTSQITKDYYKDIDIAELPELAELKNKIMTFENGTRWDSDLKKTLPREDSLHFKGNVYVLVDRFSFSMAAVVASIIQDYDLGIIIGEETSYAPSSCAGMHEFKLPNTNIKAYYPKACGVRPNGDASSRGVIPDYTVRDDIFTETDEVLDYTLKLINLN